MNFDKKTYVIIILFLCLVIALLTRGCGNTHKNNDSSKTEPEIQYFRTVDTLYFDKYITDTITVEVTQRDTVLIIDSIKGELEVYRYNNPYEDSLIKGNIFSQINLKGDLLEQRLSYTPKFPKYIIQKDSVVVTLPPVNKTKIYMGADLGVSPTYIMLKPKIGLHLKNNYNIDLGYDVFNKGVHVGFAKTFGR